MLHKEGRWVAVFGVDSATPRVWTRDQIALIEQTAERTWAAAERARAENALRHTEERHAFLLKLSDALRGLNDPADVQETAARLLGEHLQVNRVGYAEMEDHGYVIRREYTRGVAPLVGHGPSGTFGAALSESYRRGETVVVNDLSSDPRFTEAERVTMEGRQIAAFVGTTLVKNGKFLAAFGANNATPRDWTPTEIALVRDVAERTWDAVERARAEAALREREARLQLALDASAAGVWTWNAQTNRLDWDERVHAHYGLAPGGPRSLDRWISTLHEDDRQRVLDHFGRVLRCADDNDWNETFRIVRPDGTIRWMHGLGRAERDMDGRLTRIGGICLDVTERRRAEEALLARRETAALEYRTAQLSRLASDLTLAEHHAREQLAKMLHDGLQQLLLVAAVNLDQQLKRDAQLGVASDELVVQARSGLDEAIAAARSLSIELYPPVLQSSGLPAALTWLAEQTRKKYGLEVQISADPAANSGRKDIRTLLFESVRELLINAVKHAEADRVAIKLALDPDDALRITVTDEGVGFDPQALFDRAKTGRVGWGLFSIRERLTLLGGRFEIESAPGKGTMFRLIAPRGAAQDGAAAQDRLNRAGGERTTRSATSLPSVRALRILIVDDHASVRRVFRDLLQERREFVVVGEARDGVEGIAQARALRPDVILMDISMPHMDGIEATRRIRAELPLIQILGLSSQLWMEPVHPIEEAGAAGYFVKGVDMQRLIEHMLGIHASLAVGLQGRTA
jgi:PAS domain S-box-containing protein